MRRLALIAALAVAACNETPDATPAAAEPAPPEPAAQAKVDERDQYTFVRDLIEAQRTDLDDDPGAYDRVVEQWRGRRYRWELAHIPLLCRTHESCVMAPFDHQRFEKRVMQGWLPRLELDAATHAELSAACSGKKRCVVRIEATMSTLVASPDLPTSLGFSRVDIVSARDAADSESWIVARRSS